MKTRIFFFILVALTINVDAQKNPEAVNLAHSWTFDDGTAKDLVGNADGILIGGATIEDSSLLLDEIDEFMRLPANKIGINSFNYLSVCAYFSTLEKTGINTEFHTLWYFGGSDYDGNGGTQLLGSNSIYLSPARGDEICRTAITCGNIATPWLSENGINRTPEIAFGDSTWFIVTTFNDKYMSLYIDGELIDTANFTGVNSLANLKNDSAWIGVTRKQICIKIGNQNCIINGIY